MKVAIHQFHYFPWIGYLDKMAKADKFILLNDVQLSKDSAMHRARVLTNDGKEKYLTICYAKENWMEKKSSEIYLNEAIDWQQRQVNFIMNNYRHKENFEQIWTEIEHIFQKKYLLLNDVLLDSLLTTRKLFGIETELLLQSDLTYDESAKKNFLVLELCKSVGADVYLSGIGAKKYMEVDTFVQEGIQVVYHDFKHPEYRQSGNQEFQLYMSSLDLLFNEGIENARTLFWENVRKGREFDRREEES